MIPHCSFEKLESLEKVLATGASIILPKNLPLVQRAAGTTQPRMVLIITHLIGELGLSNSVGASLIIQIEHFPFFPRTYRTEEEEEHGRTPDIWPHAPRPFPPM
jgi:hypothetical protein